MIEIITVFISQFILIFLKQYNVRVITVRKPVKAAAVSFLIQGAWLVSSGLGIKAVIEMNWVVISVYLGSGFFGSLMSFKLKV